MVYFSLIIGFINVAARTSVRWEIRRLTPSVVMLLTHKLVGSCIPPTIKNKLIKIYTCKILNYKAKNKVLISHLFKFLKLFVITKNP